MPGTPRFTIIIPTKDRAPYLASTLLSCMRQRYDHLEIIVADDASGDGTQALVTASMAMDGRIRFLSHPQSIGMRENFERALDLVRPGYVMALGSDDALMPNAIEEMLQVLQSTRQDLLTWAPPIFRYSTPDTPRSQLLIPFATRDRLCDASTVLHRQARRLSYISDAEVPMIYVKGVASTDLIDRVRSRSRDGRFYACAVPDGYSGIVLAGEVRTFAFSGRPFSLYGASPSSQGAAYLSDRPQAREQSQAFFSQVGAVTMHGTLASQPYSPLISLMTADFLLTAADQPGWPGRFPPIDMARLLRLAVRELAQGGFQGHRLDRELAILRAIAAQHALTSRLQRYLETQREVRRKAPFVGSGVKSGAVFLDGPTYGFHDVLDAAHGVAMVRHLARESSPAAILRMLARSVRHATQGWQTVGRLPGA